MTIERRAEDPPPHSPPSGSARPDRAGGAGPTVESPGLRTRMLRPILGALLRELARSPELREQFLAGLDAEGDPDLAASFRLGLVDSLVARIPEDLRRTAVPGTEEPSPGERRLAAPIARSLLAALEPSIAGSDELQRLALDIVARHFRRTHGARKSILSMLTPRDEHDEKLLSDDLSRLGLVAFREEPDHHYVPDRFGRSAEKLIDIRDLPVFGPLARAIVAEGTSLLHYDRLHTLFAVLDDLARRGSDAARRAHIAEVGVYRGGTSKFLASAARSLGFDAARVHAFDTFAGHAAEDLDRELDRGQVAGKFASTDAASVRRYLASEGAVVVHEGRIQDTCREAADLSFLLVHADVDLYEPTRHLLEFFHPRLIRGGTFVVDDWGSTTCPGVRQAVGEFLGRHRDYRFFPLITGQALLGKPGDE